MTLEEFRKSLEQQLPNPNSRPFVCDGSPLDCRIFIVGTNSARLVKKPFFSFWDPSCGFKKTEFLEALKQVRGGLTRTRKNIEHVADAAGRKATLDTNIYLFPTAQALHLKKEDKTTEVFEFLMRTIKPAVVLAHRNAAIKFFRRRCRDFDDRKTAQTVTWDACQWQFRLFCSCHLGFRRLTNEAAATEARRIGRSLAKAAGH